MTSVASDALGMLLFRSPSQRIATHWPRYLALGLSCTWLAGIGRYWDNPRAHLWQHLGLGSIAYVFALALALWLLVLPLHPRRWSFRGVLVFVALTSPPALLYAIPVERFLPLDAAEAANVWFLAIVAGWRVALLLWFLRRLAGLSIPAVAVATLLPLSLILVALAQLNLEHAVFMLMAGNPADRSPHDMVFEIVTLLAMLAMFVAPVTLVAYVGLAARAEVVRRKVATNANEARS
jgi:hypothetical protein